MIILGLYLLLVLSNTFADDLEVKVQQGTIRGYSFKTKAGTTVRAFRGVPYAHPPIGSLRFQAPQAPTSWSGVRNTTQDVHSCYQVTKDTSDQSEDCLYLNVYVPVSSKKSTTKLPVLIWFHGGGYTHGSPPNPEYLIEEDIIIVAVHYRLGPFGYLATGDSVIPGNAGHKDQAAAIEWTYHNIAGFGGDPKQITISGASAGGASVGYQLLYQKNKGLIRGAILESGSCLSPWSYMDDTTAKEYAFELAKLVDSSFKSTDTTKLRDLLVKADAKKIHEASTKTTITRPLPNLEPNHSGAFLTQRSYELLEKGDFVRVPIIIGTVSEEEIGKAADTANLKKYLDKFEKNPASLIPHDFVVKDGVSKDSVGKHIESLYFNNVATDEKLGHVVRYMSHTSFTLPVIKHADLASNYTQVYFYVFSYHGKLGGNNISIKGADNVGHGEEAHYIWTGSTDLTKYPAADVLTVKRITNMWGNFVKYLNPTPTKSTLLQNITWPRFLKNEYKYLDIGSSLTLQTKPKHPYYEEWTKFYDEWAKRPFTTF